MKTSVILFLVLFTGRIMAQSNTESYPIDPDAEEQPGIPKGEILKFTSANSKIFPGTSREISVYVPAQYKADKPACVYVNQDGIQWKAPTVFDNLIAKKKMPVTIGVFVTPGKVLAQSTEAGDRFNRSFEYDGLGGNYARFLLDEVFPFVESQKATDGRALRLSKSGNDRAIGGSSSGAVCAFTAAWEYPNEFSRVFSAIGTYVGLRGADRYDILIRKQEPKPIRIFLQDGSGDLDIYAGDWWKANESMERALTFAGYDVRHAWGTGGHNGQHGTAIFPEAMRWLWRDYPATVKAGKTKNQFLNDILLDDDKGWELVGENYGFTEGMAVNTRGEVFFQDIPNSKTYKIAPDGKVELYIADSKKASGTTFSTSGEMLTITGGWSEPPTKQLHRYKTPAKYDVVADEMPGNDVTIAFNGNIYVTSPDGRERPSKLHLIRPDGTRHIVDEGLKFANGVCLSPDQTQLYVTESATHWVWVYQIQPDGMLSHKQRYGWLHVRDVDENAWSDGIKCDRDGRIYVTSLSGLQVMDPLGRVQAIIPVPKTKGQVSNLTFGGPEFDVLYITCHDKVYRRKVKVKGANNFDKPIKLPNPRL